jgi:hypothetical protein
VGALAFVWWFGACARPAPDPPSTSNYGQVTANRRAVRIPYGQYVLLRSDHHIVALKVRSRSPRGEHISYQWSMVQSDDVGTSGGEPSRGEGETSEQPYDGLITVPNLRLTWSRGSAQVGWLYWPEDGQRLEVCSQSWTELADVDPAAGSWLHQGMFRD